MPILFTVIFFISFKIISLLKLTYLILKFQYPFYSRKFCNGLIIFSSSGFQMTFWKFFNFIGFLFFIHFLKILSFKALWSTRLSSSYLNGFLHLQHLYNPFSSYICVSSSLPTNFKLIFHLFLLESTIKYFLGSEMISKHFYFILIMFLKF